MIPKVIHYVWLGGGLPPLQKACVESWSRLCPEYEIKRWDESNIPKNELVDKLIGEKNYAFASDYLRLWIMFNLGGIYLDCDVELIRGLDSLLRYRAFLVEESDGRVTNGVCGAEPGVDFFSKCIEIMNFHFMDKNVVIYSPEVTTKAIQVGFGDGVEILPSKYFYPYNPYAREIKNFMFSDVENETLGVHHWAKSWKVSFFQRLKRYFSKVGV